MVKERAGHARGDERRGERRDGERERVSDAFGGGGGPTATRYEQPLKRITLAFQSNQISMPMLQFNGN